MKKKPLTIQLSPDERKNLEIIANGWGTSLSAAVRRLILDFPSPNTNNLKPWPLEQNDQQKNRLKT